ncbi:MAG: ATP synthase F1 subunit gamma [Microgenomates group bacterium]
MNIRLVRKKIKTVSNVKKITRAMELVSAVKMKKSQQQALEGKPYRIYLEKIIQKLTTMLDPEFSPLMKKNNHPNAADLIIFISSNKGLCGAFNFNLFRFLAKKVDIASSDFITVGKKGAMFVNKMGGKILVDFSSIVAIDSVSAIFQTALTSYLEGKYNRVVIIYNKFISTLRFEPTETVLLPFSKEIKINEELSFSELKGLRGEYLIEPSPKTLIDFLLRSFIEEKIREAVYDSEAAEHSARMLAMKNATDNAQEVIYNLTLLRNKLRQEKITYELLDMITAKESVDTC